MHNYKNTTIHSFNLLYSWQYNFIYRQQIEIIKLYEDEILIGLRHDIRICCAHKMIPSCSII